MSNADIVVLLTDHKQFLKLSPDLLAQKILIDPRGLWQQIEPASDQVASQAA